MNLLLTLQRISAPIVIFGGGAWIIVEKTLIEGVVYLVLSFLLYALLTFFGYSWIDYKNKNFRR